MMSYPWQDDPAGFLRQVLGTDKFKITSGLRSPRLNAAVGGAPNSEHLSGNALDWVPTGGASLQDQMTAAIQSGTPFDQLIAEGNGSGHIGFRPGANRNEVFGRTGGTALPVQVKQSQMQGGPQPSGDPVDGMFAVAVQSHSNALPQAPADPTDAIFMAAAQAHDHPQTPQQSGQIVGAPPTAFQSLLNNPASRLVQGAIVDPVMSLITDAGRAASSITSAGGLAPNSVSNWLKNNAPVAQNAVDAAFNAAHAAGRNTPGYADARRAADQAVTGTQTGGPLDQAFAPFASGGASAIEGALQTDRNLYNYVTGNPITRTVADASNATADAVQSSLSGYQQKHPFISAASGLAPLAITGAQAVGPALGRALRSVPTNWDSAIQATRDAATDAYNIVNRSGMQISQPSLNAMVDDLYKTTVNGGRIITPDINPKLYPKTAAVVADVHTASSQPQSFTKLMELRQEAADAAAAPSTDPADAMRARIVRDHLDDYVQNLSPTDMHASGPLDSNAISAISSARDAWGRQAQASTFADLIKNAEVRSGANYGQAGFQQALIQQFAGLARNKAAFSRLTPDLQDAVQSVIHGTGSVDTLLRGVGKFAPHGALMPVLEMGAGGFAAHSGDPLTMAGAAAVPLAGELARRLSLARTLKNADTAVGIGLSGGGVTNVPTVSGAPGKMPALNARALAALLMGSGYAFGGQQQ